VVGQLPASGLQRLFLESTLGLLRQALPYCGNVNDREHRPGCFNVIADYDTNIDKYPEDLGKKIGILEGFKRRIATVPRLDQGSRTSGLTTATLGDYLAPPSSPSMARCSPE